MFCNARPHKTEGLSSYTAPKPRRHTIVISVKPASFPSQGKAIMPHIKKGMIYYFMKICARLVYITIAEVLI
jgi:hypothetical protein